MVRTKAESSTRRAVAEKAPRKALATSAPSGSGFQSPTGKGSKYAGGNLACDRPTPEWQKGIDKFLVKKSIKEEPANESDEIITESAGEVLNSSEDVGSHVQEGCSKSVAVDSENNSKIFDSQANQSSSASACSQGSVENISQESDECGSPIRRNGIIDSDDDDD